MFQKYTLAMSGEMTNADINDWITLNVGGQKFLTCRLVYPLNLIHPRVNE